MFVSIYFVGLVTYRNVWVGGGRAITTEKANLETLYVLALDVRTIETERDGQRKANLTQ